MLLLKKHLVALVRAGKKTQTIRVWSRPIVRAGQLSYTPGLGKMLIVRIDELANFSVLTEADAHADGFPDRAALLAELEKIYGAKIPAGKHCYRIHFQWPVQENGAARTQSAEAPQEKPSAVAPKRPTTPSRTPRLMDAMQRQMLKAFIIKSAQARN
jgi:hypothetical protein